MCGIGLVKFYKQKPSTELLSECENIISSEQFNRGPNNSSFWISEDNMTMICHQRLSILDISENSNQPFENKDYIGSFNGEIYNYPELSKKNNLEFKSDTLYLKHNINKKNISYLFSKFDGPFAIILYEKSTKKITIARDPFGEKPLFYFKDKEFFIVASKVRTIVKILYKLECNFSLNKKNIINILKYGYDQNKNTPIKKILSLDKGELAADNNRNENLIKKHFNKANNKALIKENSDQITLLFRKFFESSIIEKLRSDVPLGIFLSGGLDSSLVAAAARKFYSNKIESYTIDFENNKESHFKRAQVISDKLGISSHKIIFTPEKALNAIKSLPYALTSPAIDPSEIPLLVLSEFASSKTPVCLSGDGADELFNGYIRYQRFQIIEFLRNAKFKNFIPIFKFFKPKSKLSRYFNSINSMSAGQSYLNMFYQWYDKNPLIEDKEQKTSKSDFYKDDPCLMDQDLYLPEIILRKSDSCTMQYSVESRLPFISKNLINLSYTIRKNYPKLKKKDIFLPLIEYYLGKDIFYQYMSLPKYGLTVPLEMIFNDPSIQNYFNNYFNYDVISKFNFLNHNLILKIWHDIKIKKDNSNLYGMWALFTFIQWQTNLDK
ncbi:asparagine synthase (glutamine-hydrolyzing) [Prochlorococcus marinus]|uniref:asparagine synthase (glutamine-hydrolyzing) n=1 Tax=Prochlorococcus marinus TaxID=1219 RepID=UPI001ADCF5FC|nr:asparagine synthase (glutamine-hydrolyzing) [Prochlorococcus marinus]MBO8204943.1 asparagine synthase (glutamine-hydrolyzing) [Prochlorococcus marinus CUG1415]MBW3044215.1 asparagine synthase (glutamine-hydrolyzing) [Prochlorococcus marinus str. MU1415]